MYTQQEAEYTNKVFEETRKKPNKKCPICNKLVMNKINSRMIVHPMVEVQLGLKPEFEYMCYRCADKAGAIEA
jgi:DNA-directed RNA polymerase subunit RPC12/RpoP